MSNKVHDFLSKEKYRFEYRRLSGKFMVRKGEYPLFRIIEIETVNRCNGTCAFCPVNVNEPQRPYAKMSDELFEKIICELKEMEYDGILSLYSNNEPFLDTRIVDFSKKARKNLPQVYINISTNGSMLTKEKVDNIFRILMSVRLIIIVIREL